MSMSRVGLLPKAFSRIHPKYRTPSFSTIVTGFVAAIPALFLNLTEVTNLTSIGTLFAFVLVCGGVLLLPKEEATKGRFKLPYINARFIMPVLFVVGVFAFHQQFFGLFSGGESHKNFPYFLFVFLAAALTVAAFVKSLSLIPVLGLLSCFYLMASLEYESWIRFLVWLIIGLVIYFGYSYKNSVLAKATSEN